MKTEILITFIVGTFIANSLEANPNIVNWNPIDGDIVWFATDNGKMRDFNLANVFHPFATNDYDINIYYERKEGTINIQCADFHMEEANILFRVGCYVSSDIIAGGQEALKIAMNDYLSSMIPPWFRQYMEGPGNVCLIPIRSNATQPKAIGNIFFVRDNVAVRVQNLRGGGDILAFARLLDDGILASSVEEGEEENATQEPPSEKKPPVIASEAKQPNAQAETIERQPPLPEDDPPPSLLTISIENDIDGTDETKPSRLWLYLGIGVLLCAIVFLVWKRTQSKPS